MKKKGAVMDMNIRSYSAKIIGMNSNEQIFSSILFSGGGLSKLCPMNNFV